MTGEEKFLPQLVKCEICKPCMTSGYQKSVDRCVADLKVGESATPVDSQHELLLWYYIGIGKVLYYVRNVADVLVYLYGG